VLVILAIIGVVAGMAIPWFATYRARGYDARVEADARNAAAAEAVVFLDTNAYTISGSCDALPGITLSTGVTCTLGVAICPDDSPGFTVSTSHNLASRSCTWNSCGQTCADGSSGNLCCS